MTARSIALGVTLAGAASSAGAADGLVAGADGTPLFHETRGRGAETVVFLHGGPGSNFRGSGTELARLARGRPFRSLRYADQHPSHVARLVFISPTSPIRRLFDERLVALATVRGESASARLKEIAERISRAGDAETVALCRESIELAFPAYLFRPTHHALRKAAERCDIPPAAIRNRPVVEKAALGSLGDWDLRPLLGRDPSATQPPTL